MNPHELQGLGALLLPQDERLDALRRTLLQQGCTVLAQDNGVADGETAPQWRVVSESDWQALQNRADAAEAQLQERQWTERAKGVLMQAQQLGEAPAFKLLRDAAMQAHLKLPLLARQVVQQHERAELLERAAAQRMLGQRLVRLQAQRLLLPEPIDQRDAQALQQQALDRIESNLQALREGLHGPQLYPLRDKELAQVQAAFKHLAEALEPKPCATRLRQVDRLAQQLLEASEALVGALLATGTEQPLRLLSLCTRQRLLSQRLVKEALLAQADPQHDPRLLAQGLDDFLSALQTLRNAPLHSPGLQAAFDAVDDEWARLLRGLRQGGGTQALRDLCLSSERLLVALDALTSAVQRSLQTLLG